MEYLKSIFKQTMLTACIYVAMGVFLVLNPGSALNTIGLILSIGLLLAGIGNTVLFFLEQKNSEYSEKSMVGGVLLIVLGIFMFFRQSIVADLVGYILGFTIIVSGVVKLQYAFNMKRYNSGNFIVPLAVGGLAVVLGLVALFNPFSLTSALMIMIGISMIVTGVGDFVNSFIIYKGIKDAEVRSGAIDV
ncbi:MAG: DUF308 domain-containing protein [Firmicutes bacterium]|nr:DUF308 domain-containing protein [Bacillota bacterium]